VLMMEEADSFETSVTCNRLHNFTFQKTATHSLK